MVYVLFGFRVGFSLFKRLVLIFWLICFTVVVRCQQFTIWSKLLPFTQKLQKHKPNLSWSARISTLKLSSSILSTSNSQ